MTIKEACVGSFIEAKSAYQKGADRIELCTNLTEGGTTPSYGTIAMTVKNITIPVLVIIRPRGGNFVYSKEEIDIMLEDIEICKKLGVHGVVIGALTPEGRVDEVYTKILISKAKPMQITYHMAFDELENQELALEQLVNLGVDRILTKGCKTCASDGRERIKKLVDLAGDRITIIAGGGVTADNYEELINHTKVHEVHGTKIVGI
ncbi:MAG: copper homeostasis protein CutC [Firmicutes bacterium HGW-Firmicutes-7]|nr:MAG: copper homeostasis protein CutC [Firmicutes bacterium HGW-Firmicutes-7]